MRNSSIAMVLVLAGCSNPANPADSGTADSGTADSGTADVPATDTPTDVCPVSDAGGLYLPACSTLTPFLSMDPERSFDEAPEVLEAGKDYLAVIETDVGRMVLDLYEQQTPITVNSFVWLARHHFYDGIAFHRVIADFMAQTGDPNTLEANQSTWGTGGPGYYFGLEIVPELRYSARGVVGMARSTSPDSNGSQFFICFGPQAGLNNMYTIFARLVEGDAALGSIAIGTWGRTGPSTPPTRMTRVYIVERRR